MNKPNFYAILPADVRYNKKLTDKAKLIYAEIASLTNSDKICFASNSYFMKVFEVSKNTVNAALKNLKEEGYISIELTYKKDSKEVDQRQIFMNDTLSPNLVPPLSLNSAPPIPKNWEDSIKDINNIKKDISKDISKKVPKSIAERTEEFGRKVYDIFSHTLSSQEEIERMSERFIDYWTEHNENSNKMRFEKEKVFNLSRRIKTWIKNDFSSGRRTTKEEDYVDDWKEME